MNRAEFFAEMRKGFLKTIKEISSPFIAEDLEKLDHLADKVAGVRWMIAGNKDNFAPGDVHDLFLAGQSVFLFCGEKEFTAYRKLCLSCRTVPQWIPYEKKLKCLSCEKEFHVEQGSGDLKLQRCPVKIDEEHVVIGISAG